MSKEQLAHIDYLHYLPLEDDPAICPPNIIEIPNDIGTNTTSLFDISNLTIAAVWYRQPNVKPNSHTQLEIIKKVKFLAVS